MNQKAGSQVNWDAAREWTPFTQHRQRGPLSNGTLPSPTHGVNTVRSHTPTNAAPFIKPQAAAAPGQASFSPAATGPVCLCMVSYQQGSEAIFYIASFLTPIFMRVDWYAYDRSVGVHFRRHHGFIFQHLPLLHLHTQSCSHGAFRSLIHRYHSQTSRKCSTAAKHDINSLKMATFKLRLGGRGSNLRVPNQVNILVELLWRLAVEPEVADDCTKASVHLPRRCWIAWNRNTTKVINFNFLHNHSQGWNACAQT